MRNHASLLAVVDWQGVGATLALGAIAGLLTVIEIRRALDYPFRRGRGWLFVSFALDAVLAILSYNLLIRALRPGLLGSPLTTYIIAILWAPFILRARLELLVPVGERGYKILGALSSVRASFSGRVNRAQSTYWEDWISRYVVPRAASGGIDVLAERARSYMQGLGLTDEQLRLEEAKIARALSENSASKLAWVLLKRAGDGVLRSYTGASN